MNVSRSHHAGSGPEPWRGTSVDPVALGMTVVWALVTAGFAVYFVVVALHFGDHDGP